MAQQVVVIEPDYFSVEVTAPQTVTISNTGPQGPKGDTGATGATGPQGPKGDTGDPGVVQTVTGTSPITATGTTAITVGINQAGLTLAQSQITNLTTDLAAKAPLSSPTFTGDPKAPTPTSTDNDTSIATTAFVQAQKASPALTGTPTAPTAPLTTSTTQLATTEFVDEGTVDIRQFAADKSVLDNIPARIHPAEQLLKQAVFWIDANHSSASGQTITNLGWGGSALNATAGSSGSADSNDPKFLSWDGTNYVYLPGVTGNHLSVPDANDLDITGDIDIRVYVAMDDWTPTGVQYLIGKFAASNVSYYLQINTNGTFTLSWTADGSTTLSLASTASPVVTDGSPLWIRATLDVDNGASGRTGTFYTSADGLTWTQLGTTITQAGITSIFSGNANLTVGQVNNVGYVAGKVFRAQILNGINGTPVLDVDTSLITSGSNTSFIALTGQTVTINRSTSGRKTVAVTTPCWLFGTDDYIEVADNNLLDFAATESFTAVLALRQFGTNADMGIFTKSDAASATMLGWVMYNNASGQQSERVGDGTNRVVTPGAGGDLTSGQNYLRALVRNVTSDNISTYLNTTNTGTSTDTTTGTLANSVALRIGRFGGTTTGYASMEVTAAAVFRRVLTGTEISNLSNYFTGRWA